MKAIVISALGFGCMLLMAFGIGKDDPKYKNLKILPKNITHEQMDSVMHHFSNSLGVRCNFCHVHNDSTDKWNFALDDKKHKLIAREMMLMTNKINEKYFNLTGGRQNLDTKLMVTCYTCHRGATEPATVAPPHDKPEQKPARDSTRKG